MHVSSCVGDQGGGDTSPANVRSDRPGTGDRYQCLDVALSHKYLFHPDDLPFGLVNFILSCKASGRVMASPIWCR